MATKKKEVEMEAQGPMSLEEQITKLTEAEKRASSMYMETGDAAAFQLYKDARDQKMNLIQVLNQRQMDLKRLEVQQQQFAQMNYNPNNMNMDQSMAQIVHGSPVSSGMQMPMTIPNPTQAPATPQLLNPGFGAAKPKYMQALQKNATVIIIIVVAIVVILAAMWLLFK